MTEAKGIASLTDLLPEQCDGNTSGGISGTFTASTLFIQERDDPVDYAVVMEMRKLIRDSFLTHVSGGGASSRVEIKMRELEQSQRLHELLLKFVRKPK